MRISKIKIESLYGIKHLELDGNPVELRGVKGVGKTSVLDSIKFALTNKSDKEYIVKQGETEGRIYIETDNGIGIDRKKRLESGDYTKVTEFGKPVQKPQAFINEIFTDLQLNPVEFATWDKKQQNRAILNLIEFKWDLDWIKSQFGEIPVGINYEQHILGVLHDIQDKGSDYWHRREVANREELFKRQQLEDMALTFPQNYNLERWENYNLADKITKLQTLQRENGEIERANAFLENYNNKIRSFQAEKEIAISAEETAINADKVSLSATIERLKGEMANCTAQLNSLNDRLADKKAIAEAHYNEKVAHLDGDIQIAKKYADKQKVDTAELQDEIKTASEMKNYISEYKSMLKMKVECEHLNVLRKNLDEKIKLARILPGQILATADIPVAGLTVVDGVPLINGLPVSNLSGGERIELCVDITLAKHNGLQFILLDGVEALDDISREKLYQKCKDRGLQIIATRTTNDSVFTVVELRGA